MKEKYTVIQRECGEYGSVKDTNANAFINVVKYKFTMMLFFREMSNNSNTVPMEVEEAGIEAYMSDFQGMLDGLDNPSEVSGVGVGACAGDIRIERESNSMGRDGGIADGKAKPLPVSTYTCPEPRSDIESFGGVKSSLPRDERGCVTDDEVVENLVVVDEDTIPCYAVGPYLRICEYLSKGISNTIKRAWQVPPRVAKPLTPLVAPRSRLVQT